ncbi:MAG: helix-turn-helix transcriptional regulator [Candidatus Omnitrophota bacterium]
MDISKYFWDLNDKALKETKVILKDPNHPKFIIRLVNLFSRCDEPKIIFSVISKDEFIKNWTRVKLYWIKVEKKSDFRQWWQTVYDQLLEKKGIQKKHTFKGAVPISFLNIGKTIKIARIEKGLSQKDLALVTGIDQPDISKIEEGKKNITLNTLLLLCKSLDIKKISL